MFERSNAETVILPEPYGSLLAFLADLDEQTEIMGRQLAPDRFSADIIAVLRLRLAAIGLVVKLAGEMPSAST